MDYRDLNKLLSPITKAHSKANVVLMLFVLPKIDEIYAQLAGSKFYFTQDLRSGYYGIALPSCSHTPTHRHLRP